MPGNSLYARVGAALAAIASLSAAPALAGQTGTARREVPPCAACIVVVATPEQISGYSGDLHGLEILVASDPMDARRQAALEAVRTSGGTPGLLIDGLAGSVPGLEMLALAHRIVLDLSREAGSGEELAFRVKSYATELRSANPLLLIGLVASPDRLDDLARFDLEAYVDFEVRPTAIRPAFPRLSQDARVRAIQRDDTSTKWAVWLPTDPVGAQQILADTARAAPFLAEGLIAGGAVEVRCGGRPVETFLNPETLDTIALLHDCRSEEIVVVPETIAVRAALSTGDILLKVAAPEGRYGQGVDVVGTRSLTVGEIIARHQAAAARQRRHVRQLISVGRMTLTFDAPGFPAPIAVTTEAIIYADGSVVEIEQRDVRVNGIAFAPNRVPRLPLLEPERVASPPLAIELTDVYRYSLEGRETIAGVLCYVVRFEPVDGRRTLFAGRVWIAAEDFAMVKVSAVQTNLRGPIVSSEQTDEFRRAAGSVWLLSRSEIHQVYEGAGHRTPIDRLLTIDRHAINPEDFTERRQAAYASPSIMLRDTPEGFRYLRRDPPGRDGASRVTPVTAGAAERVRTVAVGVIIDPNISRPLPFAGLSYVDFNLFGTGTQMNGFFGGTFGQVAIAVPSLARTRWQLAARAFGIASEYNDRAFSAGREDYSANIAQRPAHASMWLLRPVTSRLTVRAGYELDYTAYDRVESTAASFVVPPAQMAHGLRLGVETQRGGWSASAWWSGARRTGWRAWGRDGGEYDPEHRDYQRAGATVTRAFVASTRFVGRFEAAWTSGKDLDRFSRYAFGGFDNRLRGYPSALIRYDRGGVLRGAAAWAASRFLRLDGFLDAAYVRDPGFGRHSRAYIGTGAAAEVPAPFGTLVAIEWGYGFQGIDSSGRRGTQVVRVSGYKMF